VGNKKASEDDNVPGDVLKLLGDDGLKVMIRLIIIIYETGEWSKNFIKVIVTAPNKKLRPTNFSNHQTISLIVHTAKIVMRIVGGLEAKLRMCLEKISLDL
jgi:hypothetical protein